MIRKNLLKATLITTVIATLLIQVGCGNKSANNTADTKSTISSETKSNAAKELTKTSLVTFDYTDEEGNTYTLEGKAVATESGDATIEVTDAKGNKVTFTGKATTVDGKMSVSNVTVKDEGILVKADGTEIKIGVGSTVADANENTDSNAKSDIVASDDVKKEIETAKQEEDVIIAAREEVTGVDVNNNDSSDIFDPAIEETMTEYIIQEPSIYDVTYAPIEPSTENKTEEITEPMTELKTEQTTPEEKPEETKPEETTDVLIISGNTPLSGVTINNDVYITYNGVAIFDNVTVNGNIYCYGILKCSSTTARNVYAYSGYNGMFSCSKSDGVRGVSGSISCNEMYIQDDALDYAFEKWGKY